MPPATSSQSPPDHLLILDAAGTCRWASASLAYALGFDPSRGSSLQLQLSALDDPESNFAVPLREDVLVRVEPPRGRRRWFTASGVRMGVDSDKPFLLLRLFEAPIDGLAGTALNLASHLDPATSLLTAQGLAARLAHPASNLAAQPAMALLRALNVANTPWGSTLGHRDALIGAMAQIVHQAGGQVRYVARMGVDELGVVLDGLDSWREALIACERIRQVVWANLAHSADCGRAEVILEQVLVPDGGVSWPWHPLPVPRESPQAAEQPHPGLPLPS